LTLKELRVSLPPSVQAGKVTLLNGAVGGSPTKPLFDRTGDVVRVLWQKAVVVKPGEPLELAVQF
jgi:hypothetical protein